MPSKYRIGYNKKKTSKQFEEEIKGLNPNIDLIGDYNGAKEYTNFRCRICNYSWDSSPTNLLKRKASCPNCNNKIRYDDKSFRDKVYSINDSITILGGFSAVNKRILVKCNICGKEWSPYASTLIRGKGCSNCSAKKAWINRIISQDEFLKLLDDKNPNIVLLSEFIGVTKRIHVKCKVCGYEWNPIADNLIRGKGCRNCSFIKIANAKRMDEKDFLQRVSKSSPYIDVIDNFGGTQTKIKVRCKRCGFEWKPMASSILNGTGCPRCARNQTSFMEQYILAAIEKNNNDLKVISRDRTTIGKELDIYLPSKKYAIEIGAWVWHKNRFENDLNKKLLCNKLGIRLITIYDCCSEKIDIKDVYCYKYNLAYEPSFKTLKKIIKNIISDIGEDYNIEYSWGEIEELALSRCAKLTTDDFKKKLHTINSNITVIGNYINNNTPIECLCSLCNSKWKARPYHLLMGTGCPKCAGKGRSHDEYISLIKDKINPDILLIGQYINSQTKIKCRCKKCKYEWLSLPGHIKEGKGCPKCKDVIAKRVLCITTGIEYNSIREASQQIGVSTSSISKCCNGIISSVKGLTFCYIDK